MMNQWIVNKIWMMHFESGVINEAEINNDDWLMMNLITGFCKINHWFPWNKSMINHRFREMNHRFSWNK